jgi:alpha-beta hydrolase superfamily lysophospholipase
VRDLSVYLDDLDAAFAWLKAQGPTGPLFLLGHSMGATISALYVLRRRPTLAGLILSGAPVITPPDVSPLLRRAAPLLGKVAPWLPTQPIMGISRDPEVVARTKADPLVTQTPMRAGTAAAMLRAMQEIEAHMDAFTLPLLIMHGSADRIVSPQGSRVLYERAGAADKTLHIYEGLYHEYSTSRRRSKCSATCAPGWPPTCPPPRRRTRHDPGRSARPFHLFRRRPRRDRGPLPGRRGSRPGRHLLQRAL